MSKNDLCPAADYHRPQVSVVDNPLPQRTWNADARWNSTRSDLIDNGHANSGYSTVEHLQLSGLYCATLLTMAPSTKLFNDSFKPTITTAITIRLGKDDYRRIAAAAARSYLTVVEWIEETCHTAAMY
jgi:hypothetical protein